MKRVCVRGMAPNAAGVCYVGRASGGWAASPLGNPCSVPEKPCPVCGKVHFGRGMVQLTTDRSIECYRRWLWARLRAKDEGVVGALRALREDSTLGCWCSEGEACHADVVARAWQWLRQQEGYAVIVGWKVAHVFATRKEAWDWVDGEYPPIQAWGRRMPEHVFVVPREGAEEFARRVHAAHVRLTTGRLVEV